MNKTRMFFTFALAFLVLFSAGAVVLAPAPGANAEGTQSEMTTAHVNMKSSDTLSSETVGDPDAAGETKWVQADYDQAPLSRANKRWVDVGTWTSSSRDMKFTIGGQIQFNLWYTTRDEGYADGPEFRFTLTADGTQLTQLTGQQDQAVQTPKEYTTSGQFEPVELAPSASMELKIEYRSFEDCDIYFDNATYDSGFFVESDFLKTFAYGGKDKMISIEVHDSWGANWDAVGTYVEIAIDGTVQEDLGFITKNGGTYTVDQEEYKSTLIEWRLDISPEKGQNITIWVKYTPASKGEDRGFENGFEWGSAGGGGGTPGGGSDDDDDSSDDTMLYAGIGAIAILGVVGVGAFLFMKKKKEDGGSKDFDEEDEDDDEDFDDDDEMDYDEDE